MKEKYLRNLTDSQIKELAEIICNVKTHLGKPVKFIKTPSITWKYQPYDINWYEDAAEFITISYKFHAKDSRPWEYIIKISSDLDVETWSKGHEKYGTLAARQYQAQALLRK